MHGPVDGGNTFANARVVDWGLEVDGEVVFAGPRIIDMCLEAIGEGNIVAGARVVDLDSGANDEGREAINKEDVR